ncbi:hypothetical protein CCHR01_13988 [Colletotrichum chrysophilum]|uniref:Uncharacterized protein n=1 Tax=Colletotrichum chrysophilum TaxID=1836956 RepID=A0AAD9EG07_9PEZI|nr:hypothetical protein CCHR01_13988 [Colletotrichum chrysophilum]
MDSQNPDYRSMSPDSFSRLSIPVHVVVLECRWQCCQCGFSRNPMPAQTYLIMPCLARSPRPCPQRLRGGQWVAHEGPSRCDRILVPAHPLGLRNGQGEDEDDEEA